MQKFAFRQFKTLILQKFFFFIVSPNNYIEANYQIQKRQLLHFEKNEQILEKLKKFYSNWQNFLEFGKLSPKCF